MKDYGTQKSAVEPLKVEITETKVFVASNITQVEKQAMEGQEEAGIEYQFDLVEYDKDEYIHMISEKNDALEKEVTNTQIALTEVYEMLG